jgi:hypothetical protein
MFEDEIEVEAAVGAAIVAVAREGWPVLQSLVVFEVLVMICLVSRALRHRAAYLP